MVAVGNTMWSSRFAFVMASVGFAVGLGNIWRFPYVTGENGGSAFVVIYLLCALAIGITCLMAELLVGRRGGGSPPRSMAVVAKESGRGKGWSIVGGMGVATASSTAATSSAGNSAAPPRSSPSAWRSCCKPAITERETRSR